jgi:hypothetical protein
LFYSTKIWAALYFFFLPLLSDPDSLQGEVGAEVVL